MKKNVLLCTLLFALLASSTVCRSQAAYSNPVIGQSAPDPTVIKVGNSYYLYATEDIHNVPIFHSYDLIQWTFKGTAFTNSTRPTFVSGGGIWAPDINYINGKYVMYYSMSTWGGEWACGIGVAVADQPEGPFTDRGKLFISTEIGVQNSIDPCFFEDGGKKYLFWGSFRGIYAIELAADGLSVKSGSSKVQVAGTAFEATYIHKRGSYYYLFASWGSCCNGLSSTYTTVVGRSTSLLGPYVNKSGGSMMSNNYSVVIQGNATFKGVGHNSRIVQDRVGNDWILYHGFSTSAPDQRRVFLDRITWSSDWPVVSGNVPSSKANAPEPLPSMSLPDGIYNIQAKTSGKNVEVPGGDNNNGAKIRLWTANTATCQQWMFTRQSDGAYKLINIQSGKALDLPSGTSDNVQLQQYNDNGETPQRWYVYDMGGGYVKFKNRASGKPMEIANNGTADGTVVRQWDNNDSDAQRFKLIPVALSPVNYSLVLGTTANAPYTPLLSGNTTTAGSTVYVGIDNSGSWVNRTDCNLTSSNTSVATIDVNGKITALTAGKTTITAILKTNANAKGSIELTVTDNGQPPQPPDNGLTSNGQLKLKIVAYKVEGTAVTDDEIKTLPNNSATAGCIFINETDGGATVTRQPPTAYTCVPTASVSQWGTISTTGISDCMLTIKAVNNEKEGLITIAVGASNSVSIPETNVTNNINVFATETGVGVQFEGEALIELYAVTGILIDKAKASQTYFHNAEKGVYIVIIHQKGQVFRKKLIIN